MSGLNRLQLANALIGLPTAELDQVRFALKPLAGIVPTELCGGSEARAYQCWLSPEADQR